MPIDLVKIKQVIETNSRGFINVDLEGLESSYKENPQEFVEGFVREFWATYKGDWKSGVEILGSYGVVVLLRWD